MTPRVLPPQDGSGVYPVTVGSFTKGARSAGWSGCLRALLAGLVLSVWAAGSLSAQVSEPRPVSLGLTNEEKAFLAGRKIRLAVDSARPPFEFIDSQGVYSGISASFIQACAGRLGLQIEVVPGLTVAQGIDKADAGAIEVIPKITPTAERGKHLLFTVPYNTFPSVIVSRKDAKFIGGLEDLTGLKVGVLKGLVVEELLKRDHPNQPLVALPNVKEALLQLSTGQIDVFIDNLGTVAYNIDQLGMTNLKIAAPTPYTHDLAFGVRKDMPLLRSALDKALASLSTQERAAIKAQWLGTSVQKGVEWAVLAPYLGIAGVVALLLLARNRYLRGVVRERQRIQAELEEHARQLESQAQLKSSLTILSAELQKARTFGELATVCFAHIAPATGLASGALHVLDEEEGVLRFAGGYGRTGREVESQSCVVGHGLIGQCARDDAPIDLTDPKGIPFTALSGYGELVLRELLILPIRRQDKVVGVLSLASPTRFDVGQRGFLDEILPILALNLEILAGSAETQRLLERSQIQARILGEAQQKNRAILDSIQVGMLLIDPRRGTIVDANPVAVQMLGHERADILGQACGSLACSHRVSLCAALERRERIENAEERLVNAEGREIPVLKTVVPVALGDQEYLLESFVDISAQKELELQLRESGERLRVISDAVVNSPAAVMITDSQGNIEYVNPKFEQQTGYSAGEVIGRNPRLLKSGEHPAEVYSDLWTSILSGRIWRSELCNRRKNGQFYWEQVAISPIQNEAGQITHFVSVREDITERKRLDAELKQHMDELERFARLTVDREERMIELKREINEVLREAGLPARYTLVE